MVSEQEEQSLDLVQRVVISALVIVVMGSMAAVLAFYLTTHPASIDASGLVGLWVMTGVIGVITAVAVLVINRRRPYSPWAVLGLLPMAVSAYWILS